MRNFRQYSVWRHSIDLTDQIYALTRTFPSEEKYGLISQMRRASVSIASNFVEGYGRDSPKEFIRFVEYALSSAYEVETQIIVAERQYPECFELGFLSFYIKSRRNSMPSGTNSNSEWLKAKSKKRIIHLHHVTRQGNPGGGEI